MQILCEQNLNLMLYLIIVFLEKQILGADFNGVEFKEYTSFSYSSDFNKAEFKNS